LDLFELEKALWEDCWLKGWACRKCPWMYCESNITRRSGLTQSSPKTFITRAGFWPRFITGNYLRDINAHFRRHYTYYDLAIITVYTRGKTSEETCQEILERVKWKGPGTI
jgi:hypothetical protein